MYFFVVNLGTKARTRIRNCKKERTKHKHLKHVTVCLPLLSRYNIFHLSGINKSLFRINAIATIIGIWLEHRGTQISRCFQRRYIVVGNVSSPRMSARGIVFIDITLTALRLRKERETGCANSPSIWRIPRIAHSCAQPWRKGSVAQLRRKTATLRNERALHGISPAH